MKSKKFLAFFITAVMLLGVVPSAHANHVSLQISFTSGNAGTKLLGGSILATRVSATGNTAESNDIVQLLWNGAPFPATDTPCSPNPDCTAKTAANGNYVIRFSIPLDTAGMHDVTAKNTNATDLSVTLEFTVQPVIELASTSGVVGAKVQVWGSGFAATSSNTITLGTAQAGSGSTDSQGSLVSSSGTSQILTVPESVHGSHGVTVSDPSGNKATKTFFVQHNVELTGESDPAVPPPAQAFPVVGSTIRGRATGFGDTESITLFFSTTLVPSSNDRSIGLFTTNPVGSFSFSDTIPPTPQFASPPASNFNYVANDTDVIGTCSDTIGSAGLGCASLSVPLNPLLILTPDHADFGQSVMAHGLGFWPNAEVTITVTHNGSTVASLLLPGDTGSTGSFEFGFVFSSLTTPSLPAGKYIVNATDDHHFTDLRRFFLGTQIIPTPDHGIARHPSGNIHGTVVTVDGFVFTPNNMVTIFFDGNAQGTVMADGNGDFTTTFEVPEALGGPGTDRISATDNAHTPRTASAAFRVDSWIKLGPDHGKVGSSITVWGTGFPAAAVSAEIHYCGVQGATDALSPDIAHGSACPVISVVPLDTNFREGPPTKWTVFTTGITSGPETMIATMTLDSLGSFTATFAVPESWGGFHSVFANAVDSSGAVVSSSTNGALFRVQLSISTDPASAQKDRQVTLQGTGFFQWEKYFTQQAGASQVLFTEQASLVVDFGPTLRYVDQANFILNGQFDIEWSFGGPYQPVALNERGSIVNAGFQGVVSPGSQFIKVPSLEPDQYTLTAYYFKMSNPRYSTDETASSSFTVSSPEIQHIDTVKTDMLGQISHMVDGVNANIGNVMADLDNSVKGLNTNIAGVMSDLDSSVKGINTNIIAATGGVTTAVNAHVDSATSGITSAVNAHVDSATSGITSAVNAHVDSATAGITTAVNAHVDSATAGITSAVNAHVDSATAGITSSVNDHVDSATAGVTSAVNNHVDAMTAGVTKDVNTHVDSATAGITTAVNAHVDSATAGVTSSLSNVQGSVNTAAQGVSSLQNNLPQTVQNPLGYTIAILAAIAAIGSIGAVIITSRRLKVAA